MNWKPNKWIALALGMLCMPFAVPMGLIYVGRIGLALLFCALQLGVLAGFMSYPGSMLLVVPMLLVPLTTIVLSYRLAARSEPQARRPVSSGPMGLLAIVASAAALLFLLRAVGVEPYKIRSSAMVPGYPKGTMIVVQKYGYGNYAAFGVPLMHVPVSAPIRRGEVFVFEPPDTPGIGYIMRVVGVGGDHIVYRNKQLSINGVAAWRGDPTPNDEGEGDIQREHLDAGDYATLGRDNAPIKEVDTMVEPGKLFFLGDSRDNARDSRYFGQVPLDHVIGKVVRSGQIGQ